MQRAGDGRKYVLVFQDAPWRDGEEIVLDSRHDVGDRIEISHGDEASRGAWEVGDVWESPEEEPDTLAIWKPPIRDA